MKILSFNSPISFKNNDFSKILSPDMFGADFANPLARLERDIFEKKQQEKRKRGGEEGQNEYKL